MSQRVPDDLLRTMIQWRHNTLVELLESENENNRQLAQAQPDIVKNEFFVKLQMRLVVQYMKLVCHENRYIFERLLHIFWILAMLVLFQFHLLHISSFSYIKCMSDQIIESLENPALNHTYAFKALNERQTKRRGSLNVQSLMDQRQSLYSDFAMNSSDWVEKDSLCDLGEPLVNQLLIKYHIGEKCPIDQELDQVLNFAINVAKLDESLALSRMATPMYEYQTNHTYFREFFNQTTDVFLFRIVDYVSAINQQTTKDIRSKSSRPRVSHSKIFNGDHNGSIILKKELEGQNNLIASNDIQDILRTIKLLNDSYNNSTQNFYKLVDQEMDSLRANHTGLHALGDFGSKTYKLFANFFTGKLMNDNTYAFSYNQSLLNLTSEELISRGVRLSYVQVDSMHKCVPQDWFLGYDQFAVYTFHKLAGQIKDKSGYLKTYFRQEAGKNLRDRDPLMVSFSKDFKANFNPESSYFYVHFIWQRWLNMFFTFFDLGLCYGLSTFAVYIFQQVVFVVSQEPSLNLNFGKIIIMTVILLIIKVLPSTLSHANNPFSVSLIAYTCMFSMGFSTFFLQHSRYQSKYKFWMFMGSYLNYSYQQTYPYCNVTLCNLVFVTFTWYQFLHNLFKFSYHLEMVLYNLQNGNLGSILPAYIQNELQQRNTSRTIGRQFREQREQDERERQQDARNLMEGARRQRLADLETNLRNAMRTSGTNNNAQQIEQQVQGQMQQVREILQSSQYQEILDQFSTLLHRPSQVMRQVQEQSQSQGLSQNAADQRLNQFQTYTEEVNRQITSINNLLQTIQTNFISAERDIIEEAKNSFQQSLRQRTAAIQTNQAQVQPQPTQPVQPAQPRPLAQPAQPRPLAQPVVEVDEPSLPRFTLGDQYSRQNPITGRHETVQGGAYHNYTASDQRAQYRVKMRSFGLGNTASIEQQDCIKCACHNCFKMFMASVRHMEGRADRDLAFSQMSQDDIDLQMRLLGKQFSMAVELLGSDFVLNRSARNREYENRYGRGSSQYTKRMKQIDDMHELCELIQLSQDEHRNQRMNSRAQGRDFSARTPSAAELIMKLTNPNYKVKTLDDFYPEPPPSRVQPARQVPTPVKPTQTSGVPLLITRKTTEVEERKTESTYLAHCKELSKRQADHEFVMGQDWMPVIQTLIVNQSGLKDNNKYVKQQINFKDPMDPSTRMTVGDIRFFNINPTYILTFADDANATDKIIRFISQQLQVLGHQSIWRDPKRHSIDPIDIKEMSQFVNLKLKLQFGDELKYKPGQQGQSLSEVVNIERLCMLPIMQANVPAARILDQKPRYGKDKIIQSSLTYIQKPKKVVKPKTATKKQASQRMDIDVIKIEPNSPVSSSKQSSQRSNAEEAKVSNDQLAQKGRARHNSSRNDSPLQIEPIIVAKKKRGLKKKQSTTQQEEQPQEEYQAQQNLSSEIIESGLGSDEMIMMLEYFQKKIQDIMVAQQEANQVSIQQIQSRVTDNHSSANQATSNSQNNEDSDDTGGFVIGNINHELLILQNQIEQAAFALRSEDPVTGEKILITQEDLRNSPQKMQQIQHFQNAFFNEMQVDTSCFQAAMMNKDERRFMKQFVKKNLDIIQLFPALYPLQSQMMVLSLLKQKDRSQNSQRHIMEQRLNLERELALASALIPQVNSQNKGNNQSQPNSA